MNIDIETETLPPVIRLVGRFDAHETQEFRARVTPVLTSGSPVVRLDLSQVAFVDSSALSELVRLQKTARSLGGEVILTSLSDPVRVILEITELAELFPSMGTTTEAGTSMEVP